VSKNALNLNLEDRIFIDTNAAEWQDSPSEGVLRKPLERIC
jgi:hypothetical protein